MLILPERTSRQKGGTICGRNNPKRPTETPTLAHSKGAYSLTGVGSLFLREQLMNKKLFKVDDKVTNGHDIGKITGIVSDKYVRVYWYGTNNLHHTTEHMSEIDHVAEFVSDERHEP